MGFYTRSCSLKAMQWKEDLPLFLQGKHRWWQGWRPLVAAFLELWDPAGSFPVHDGQEQVKPGLCNSSYILKVVHCKGYLLQFLGGKNEWTLGLWQQKLLALKVQDAERLPSTQ
jgi:hypothetical protein